MKTILHLLETGERGNILKKIRKRKILLFSGLLWQGWKILMEKQRERVITKGQLDY